MGGSGPNGRLLAGKAQLWLKMSGYVRKWVVVVKMSGCWLKTGGCGRKRVVMFENGW